MRGKESVGGGVGVCLSGECPLMCRNFPNGFYMGWGGFIDLTSCGLTVEITEPTQKQKSRLLGGSSFARIDY